MTTNTIGYRPSYVRQDEAEAWEWDGVRIGILPTPDSELCGIVVSVYGHGTQEHWEPGDLPLGELRAEIESVFLSVPR